MTLHGIHQHSFLFSDIPRYSESCCSIGLMVGNNGLHCKPKYYRRKIQMQNRNMIRQVYWSKRKNTESSMENTNRIKRELWYANTNVRSRSRSRPRSRRRSIHRQQTVKDRMEFCVFHKPFDFQKCCYVNLQRNRFKQLFLGGSLWRNSLKNRNMWKRL